MMISKRSGNRPSAHASKRALQLKLVILAAIIALASGIFFYQNRAAEVSAPPKSQPVARPAPTARTLTLDDFSPVIAKSKPSVVQITGTGCGYDYYGSGFVVAPDLVATNAHVVAGIAAPTVSDSEGSYTATPVLFDTKKDFAVLRVKGLGIKPLPLADTSSRVTVLGMQKGEQAVLMGYPDGGGFAAELARITDEYSASLTDIYGNPDNVQSIYDLKANVVQGDSGSPLIRPDGKVTGIIFGKSPTDGEGFALPLSQFADEVQAAKKLSAAVDTQACIVEP